MRYPVRLLLAACAAAIGACGDDAVAPVAAVALHVGLVPQDVPFAMQIGATARLQAVRVAADSSPLGGPVPAAWTSADTSVASVDASGTVHVRCVGMLRIMATYAEGGRTLQGSRDIPVTTTGARCAAP
jgi:hypothetical protein